MKPLTKAEISVLKAGMVFAAKSGEQPSLAEMIYILFSEAPNDEIAVVSRTLDRMIQFFHLIFLYEPRLQTLKNIAEAREYSEEKNNARNIDPFTTLYHIHVILKLLNTNNEAMPAIRRVGAFVACYLHSKIHDIPDNNMESTINVAMRFVETHLTKEPEDFSALVKDVEAFESRVTKAKKYKSTENTPDQGKPKKRRSKKQKEGNLGKMVLRKNLKEEIRKWRSETVDQWLPVQH